MPHRKRQPIFPFRLVYDSWRPVVEPAQDFPEGFNHHVLRVLGPDRYSLRLDACPEEDGECVEGSYSYVAERRASPAP